jgi:DNA-binding LacI/PurR family transcriptional regulator
MTGIPRRRPRLDDVAAKVGVSTGTVSLVLSNAPGPSAATRERVMAAAAELGYRPDRTASLLARRRAHLLGVMLDVRSTFHAELVAELHDAAEAAGYDVLLSTVTPTRDSRRAIETLVDSRCEALVLLAPDAPTPRLTTLGEQIPVVVVGRRLRSTTLDVVRTADDHGVGAAVEHLVELGHRDIAFVDGGQGTIATDRRSGYLRAMRRHGLEDRVRVLAGDQTEVAGTSAAKDLVDGDHPPTAVVTYNDRVALGLLDGLLRAGVAVPEEVSVVGYDDSPSAHLPHVDLTTVSQDTRRQAENAVQAAVERLDAGRTTPRQVVLEPRLVVRRTTSVPRARAALTRGAVNGAAARSTAP